MKTKEDLRKENSFNFCFPYNKGMTRQDFKILAASIGKDMTELLGELVLDFYLKSKRTLEKPS